MELSLQGFRLAVGGGFRVIGLGENGMDKNADHEINIWVSDSYRIDTEHPAEPVLP